VAAGEDQTEAVVAHGVLLRGRVAMVDEGGLGVAIVTGRFPPEPVDGLVTRRGDDPAARVRGHAGHRPPLGGHHEGLLDRLLGEVDVAEEADQCGHGTAELLAEGQLDS